LSFFLALSLSDGAFDFGGLDRSLNFALPPYFWNHWYASNKAKPMPIAMVALMFNRLK
jgi:hypothetical protein